VLVSPTGDDQTEVIAKLEVQIQALESERDGLQERVLELQKQVKALIEDNDSLAKVFDEPSEPNPERGVIRVPQVAGSTTKQRREEPTMPGCALAIA
jgi:hypothetical protein